MNYLKVVLSVIFFGLLLVLYFNFYSYIHSRKVEGIIVKVERVNVNVALMQEAGNNQMLNPQLFSFAVAIKESTGEIVTASAEDRQWAVASSGQCAEARFYPYPPWNLDKAGTYFNARLDRLWDCSSK